MADDYEIRFQLDSTNAADGAYNDDSDGLVNSNEAALGTDPWIPDTDRDGFRDDADSNPVSRVVITWGEPLYSYSNEYFYTGPPWWLGAWKEGGDWTTNSIAAWRAPASLSNDFGNLLIAVDRLLLTNDARLHTTFRGSTGATLYVDLDGTNGWTLATNLFGNLITAPDTDLSTNVSIPFAQNSDAAMIRLRRGTGEISVYENLLYVDEDSDGLDAEQETQLGTSDFSTDSDADGINDSTEVLRGTDPADDQSSNIMIWVNDASGSDAHDGYGQTVSAGHGPKKTIHGGIGAGLNGDTIVIAAGTYQDEASIFASGNKHLTFQSSGSVIVK